MNRKDKSNLKKGLITIGVALILILGVLWIVRYMQIDACLDNGGRWNYELNECEPLHTIDTERIAEYYWKSDYDTTLNKEFLKRGVLIDSISTSPSELIRVLNMRPSKSKIDFVKIVADTLFIRILNDTFLTQQMGSLGARYYMAETVFTLTENESIQLVKFDMNIGSHANLGVYSRADFKGIIRD